LAEDPAAIGAELEADSGSLRVIEGSGGIGVLGDDDKASIEQTINDEVLERRDIRFRSTAARPAGDGIRIEGELTIGERTGASAFDLVIGDDGAVSASAGVKQTDWGITPFSALFGALKVKDEVRVVLDGHLDPAPGRSQSA
jgi:hypothetical protein